MKKHSIAQSEKAIEILREFINPAQLSVIASNRFGEEGQYFIDHLCEICEVINKMPKTYEQDGKGMKAVAFLHYFKGGYDAYITEKDSNEDGEGQTQAFGWASFGHGGELGHISIIELIENGVDFDEHFTPKTLEDLGLE